MRLIDTRRGRPVEEYGSSGDTWTPLGEGVEQTQIGVMRMEPEGTLGRHAAPSDQLFLVVEGQGWVAGSDGEWIELVAGQGAIWGKGEPGDVGGFT
jgi:quercetin dioxygenase-like cupin family protein